MSIRCCALMRACAVLVLSTLPWSVTAAQSETNTVTYSDYQKRLSQPLTLHAAIAEALKNNLSLERAEAGVDERRGERRHASRWVPKNPELELETAERESPGDSSSDFGIRFSQELWIGGQRGAGKAAASARVEAARSRLAYLRMAVAARTRRAFLNLLWAQQAVATAERLVEINRQFERFARKRLASGENTIMEVNSAAIGLSRAQGELADARNAVERARLQLAEMLSRDPGVPLTVRGELNPWRLDLPDRYTLLKLAAQQRDDLAAAARKVDAARRDLQLSRRQLIPNLTVFGFYREEEDFEVSGGGVSLPLPVLHRYGGEREAAQSRLRQRQLEQDTQQLAVRREVLTAVADYRAAARKVELLGEGTLARAEKNVSLIQKAFRAGKVGAPAITSAQDNLISVRRSYLDALRELVVAVTDLERSTGGLARVTAGAEKQTDEVTP